MVSLGHNIDVPIKNQPLPSQDMCLALPGTYQSNSFVITPIHLHPRKSWVFLQFRNINGPEVHIETDPLHVLCQPVLCYTLLTSDTWNTRQVAKSPD